MAKKPRISRGIRDRRKLVETLYEIFGSSSVELARRRTALFQASLQEGETVPDFELEQDLWLRLADRRCTEAEASEAAYGRALIELGTLEHQRDQATAEMNTQLGALRQIVDLARGRGATAEELDLKGRTGRRHEEIYHQAKFVLARLKGLKPTDPRLKGIPADPAQWHRMIEPPFRQLEELKDPILRQESRVQHLLDKKNQAFAGFDNTFRSVINVAVGHCKMVGMDGVAERIRRFARRRRRPGPKKKRRQKS